jgi:hypothetical protein
MSSEPSLLVVKKTPGREGDQQPSVRYDEWYLFAQNSAQFQARSTGGASYTDLVVIMGDLRSSNQMRAVQSPTVRKYLEKNGLRCRA